MKELKSLIAIAALFAVVSGIASVKCGSKICNADILKTGGFETVEVSSAR